VGRNVVVIGAGNVGCDVATEARRLGARDITLIDVQEPASFGREREEAEKAGAKFLWPVSAKAITGKKVELADGRILKADTVIFAIGDKPDLSFLPESVETEKGYIKVENTFQTTDPLVFAIGDTVRPGLLTDAIGAGKDAARIIDARLRGLEDTYDRLPVMDTRRIRLEYYDPGCLRGRALNGARPSAHPAAAAGTAGYARRSARRRPSLGGIFSRAATSTWWTRSCASAAASAPAPAHAASGSSGRTIRLNRRIPPICR
jgi:threonine dehydrogenase-like Zn-dependent dehydrogenase